MADDEQAVSGEEEVARPRLSKMAWLVIAFSAGLGVLFLTVVGGGIYFAKKTSSLQTELATVKKELKGFKELAQTIEGTQGQIKALAERIDALKEPLAATPAVEPVKAVAVESEPVKAHGAKTEPHAQVPAPKEIAKEPAKENKPAPAAPVSEPAKAKRASSDAFSCDLSGKSQEEQAAILKRCVSVMDTPAPKSRGGGR